MPVSLKQLRSDNPLAILQDVRKANDVGGRFGITGVTMFVDAPNMNLEQLTKFAEDGPLTGSAVAQGVVGEVVVKTSAGYITIGKSGISNGVPRGWTAND